MKLSTKLKYDEKSQMSIKTDEHKFYLHRENNFTAKNLSKITGRKDT